MRTKRFVLLAGLVASVAVPLALAATIDRVVVGVPGRNDTRGFSSKLYVEVMVEPDYQKVDFDGDSGNWLGPPYHATAHPNLGGRAKASWSAYFDKGISVQQAMEKHFTQGWERMQEFRIEVPHVVNDTRVAVITGQWRLTKGPGEHNTQFEGVLSFPLCKRVVVIHHGRLLFDGLLASLADRFAAYKTIEAVLADGERVSLRVPRNETSQATARLLAEHDVHDLTVEDPPIEDVIEQVFAS